MRSLLAPSFTICLIVLLSSLEAAELQTLDGGSVSGSIVSLDAKSITIESDQGKKEVPTDSLLQVQFPVTIKDAELLQKVTLIDGSEIAASFFRIEKDTFIIERGDESDELRFPKQAVKTVIFQPLDEKYTKTWAEIIKTESANDLVVVNKNDSLDYLEGKFGNAAEKIEFSLNGSLIQVKREKAYGMVFNHSNKLTAKETLCGVQDYLGATIPAAAVSLQSDGYEITTIFGNKVLLTKQQVRSLNFGEGKIVYLSDLKPLSVKVVSFFEEVDPFFQVNYPPIMDRNARGNKIKIGSSEYSKGLVLRSGTTIAFPLRGKYKTLKSVLGIESEGGNRGRLQLMIKADQKEIFNKEIRAEDLTNNELEFDVEGVTRLEFIVQYGNDNSDSGDYLGLGNTRLIK